MYKKKRSSWKLPFIPSIFFDNKFFKSSVLVFQTMNRKTFISLRLINSVKKVSLYSGNTWKSFHPRYLMLGLKLGEFCFTKVFGRFVNVSLSIKAKRKKQDKKKK